MICTAHLERTGEQREAYRLDLCLDCYHGQPINAKIEQGGYGYQLDSKTACDRRYRLRNAEREKHMHHVRYLRRKERLNANRGQ